MRPGSLLPDGTAAYVNSLGRPIVQYMHLLCEGALTSILETDSPLPEGMRMERCDLSFVSHGAYGRIKGDALEDAMPEGDVRTRAVALLATAIDLLDSELLGAWPIEAVEWNARRRSMIGGPALHDHKKGGELLSTPWSRGATISETDGARMDIPDDEDVCGPRPVIVNVHLQDMIGETCMRIDTAVMRRVGTISTMDALRHLSAYRRND